MTHEAPAARFTSVADHALLVDFSTESGASRDDAAEAEANARVIGLDDALSAAMPIAGVREVVPALVNLLVSFDPVVTDHAAVEHSVRALLNQTAGRVRQPNTHRVAVCYDEPLAPDLSALASASGISVDATIAAHLAGDYRVLMYGFAPGYAYLGGVPSEIRVARKPTPVRGVAAGSVIVAGPQCLITTITMPTGWSRIGASPTRVMPSNLDEPFLFDPGDRVAFHRIDRTEYDRLQHDDASR